MDLRRLEHHFFVENVYFRWKKMRAILLWLLFYMNSRLQKNPKGLIFVEAQKYEKTKEL